MTYDEGLHLPTGPVTATNTTGRPERVLLRPEELPPWRR